MLMCSNLHFGSLSKLQISVRMFLLCCLQPAVLQGNEETFFFLFESFVTKMYFISPLNDRAIIILVFFNHE